MIERRGSDRRSMLTGSSTHNQRIEHLWRDMHSCVTMLFYKLFYYLEQQDLLNPFDLNLWALHYVFLPRINRCLVEFIHSLNTHPIRTACHKTPQQLFTAGSLVLQTSNVDAFYYAEAVDSNYGLDPDITVIPNEAVVVPENPIKFSESDIQALKRAIDPLGISDHGIDIYEQTLQQISTFNPSLLSNFFFYYPPPPPPLFLYTFLVQSLNKKNIKLWILCICDPTKEKRPYRRFGQN